MPPTRWEVTVPCAVSRFRTLRTPSYDRPPRSCWTPPTVCAASAAASTARTSPSRVGVITANGCWVCICASIDSYNSRRTPTIVEMWQGSYARAHPVAVHHDTLGGDRPGGAARWTAGLTSPVAFPHLPVPPLGLARG